MRDNKKSSARTRWIAGVASVGVAIALVVAAVASFKDRALSEPAQVVAPVARPAPASGAEDQPGADVLLPKLQAVMFKKVLPFNRSLEGSPLCIRVAHSEEEQEAASTMALAFREVGVEAYARSVGAAIDAGAEHCRVAYVFPGAADALAPEAVQGLMLVSGFPELRSKVVVTVGRGSNQKPKIWISKAQMEKAQIALEKQLLMLAQVDP